MALIRIRPENQYSALSTDVANNKIAGLSNVGAVVYLTDTKVWKIVNSDLTLSEYDLPVNFNGTVDIGTVDQGTGGSSSWKVTLADSSAANTARSTSTLVQPVQIVDEAGNVSSVIPKGLTHNIRITPTLTVHANYATGDYVGTSGAPVEFANSSRINAGTGWIVGASLENNTMESIPMELWLFDATVTPPNDSDPWTISDADAQHCIGVLTFGTDTSWFLSGTNAYCHSLAVAYTFTCGTSSTSIFGCLVTRGSLTSTSLTATLNVAQD